MSLRSLERTVIKNRCYRENHNTKGFKKAWAKYHYSRTETANTDGSVVVTRGISGRKKKQRHRDNGKLLVRELKAFKNFIDNVKKSKEEKQKAEVVSN